MCRKGNPLTLLVGMQAGAATLENSMEVPQEVNNRTTLWPINCTTRNLFKGYKNADLKGHMHPNIYSSTINNSQIMERTQMSMDWWMDKEECIHTQWHITQPSKRMKSCHLQQVDRTRMYYVKWNVSQRKINTIWFHSYVEFTKENRWGHLAVSVG